MEKKQKFFIVSDQVKSNCLRAVQSILCDSKKPMTVEIRPQKRSEALSAKFHAMCRDMALQAEHNGEKYSEQDWKVFLISGHEYELSGKTRLVAGLHGEICKLRESSAEMTNRRMSSLIEFTYAIGASKGVRFTERDTGGFYG
ncbi:MAG: recombination protein NinB [Plesiomonas shigelloides]